MRIRGVIRTAELAERSPGGEEIEMVLRVQGVGPGQPRFLIVPYALLLRDETLDPGAVAGRGFSAEVGQDGEGRWVVAEIGFASKVLRPGGEGAG